MAKVIGPCFGLDARGALGKAVVYSIRRGVNYTRSYIVPKDKKSNPQIQNRAAFHAGVSNWRFEVIPGYQKDKWTSYSTGTSESGFNRFMRYYLKANYNTTTKLQEPNESIPSPH